MDIESRAVAPFFKNGFLVSSPATRAAIVIDPGDEVDELIELAEGKRLDVKAILLTHGHVDHVTGVTAARERWGVPIYLHPADRPLYDNAPAIGRMFGLEVDAPPPADHALADGDILVFGDLEVRIHHTPGHCPGGVCLELRGAGEQEPGADLIVGDTLFAGSIGRTDLPGGDTATLLDSIRRVLFAFPAATRVHPGHGPSTTIAEERATNPFVADGV